MKLFKGLFFYYLSGTQVNGQLDGKPEWLKWKRAGRALIIRVWRLQVVHWGNMPKRDWRVEFRAGRVPCNFNFFPSLFVRWGYSVSRPDASFWFVLHLNFLFWGLGWRFYY